MNLVTDPWIPVLDASGASKSVSLMQVFSEHSAYRDLAVRPHERVALMRLLICIAQAALNGPNEDDDASSAHGRLPLAAQLYLSKFEKAFDLFDPEEPFLQVVAVQKPLPIGDKFEEPIRSPSAKRRRKSKSNSLGEGADDASNSVAKMDFALAAGNNTTLFDHQGTLEVQRSFSSSAVALMLLSFQNYAQGGGKSASTWIDNARNFADAPCKPSSMLHTFIRRKTLLESICANLLTREQVENHYGGSGSWGKPIWEFTPVGVSDGPAVDNATRTYLGRLVPLSRLIQLKEGSGAMLLASGLEYPRFPEFPAEPSATVVMNKERTERRLLGAGVKAIWRELPALITFRRRSEAGGALALQNLPESEQFDIWVGALLIHPKKTAEVIDTIESVITVHPELRTDSGRASYGHEVRWAEGIAGKLGGAVEKYRQEIDRGWEGRVKAAAQNKSELKRRLHGKATRHFWTAVEKSRWLLLAHIEAIGSVEKVERSREAWRKEVHRAARDSYQLACGQDTSRQIRAFALGWEKLFTPPKAAEEIHGTESAEVEG